MAGFFKRDISQIEAAWRAESACRGTDPELFYPEHGASNKEAKDVCRGCPVRADCLEYALTNNEKFGIWGGLTERERRRLYRRTMARPVGVTAVTSVAVHPHEETIAADNDTVIVSDAVVDTNVELQAVS